MSLPSLLRQLRQRAADRDRTGVIETFGILSSAGFGKDVAAFIGTLSPRDVASIVEFTTPAPSHRDVAAKFNPSAQQSSGGGYQLGTSNASMSGVTRDATSLIYSPSTAAEWTSTLAVAAITTGGPSNGWTMQDAATPSVDMFGVANLAGSGTGYQQAVTGWARKATTVVEAGAGGLSSVTIGNLASSGLMLGYVQIRSTPGALRDVMGMGSGAACRYALVTTGPVYAGKDNNGGAEVDGLQNPGTTVHPVIVQVDRTAGAFRVITDQEIITPIYQVPGAGALLVYGVLVGTTAPAGYLYGAYFSGAAAEMSTTKIRTLLQTLGWTVSW